MQHQDLLVNFSLMKPVGEISEKRVKTLVDKEYRLIKFIPDQMAHFSIPRSHHTMLIGQNQITIQPDVNSLGVDRVLENPLDLIDLFRSVLDILLLDEKAVIDIVLERKYFGKEDSLKQSFSTITPIILEQIKSLGATSVGLRVPIQLGDFHGEVRLEPFFREPDNYFIGCHLQSNTPWALDQCNVLINNMLRYFKEKAEPVVNFIFIQK